jgi:hypothetical protein
LYNNFDLSSLKEKKEILNDVSIIWRPPYASVSNFQHVKEFIRSFIVDNLWSRNHEDMNPEKAPPFYVCFSEAVLNKIKDGKTPIYIKNIINKWERKFASSHIISSELIAHPLINELENILYQQDNHDFNFSFIGGGRMNISNEKEYPLPVLWREFIGERPIPIDFKDRAKAFPKAYNEFGDRFDYYRSTMGKE